MPTLNFPTNGPTGKDIVFSSWKEYSKTIGFFHNPNNHKYLNKCDNYNPIIHITIEANDKHGAYGKEGRIVIFNTIELSEIKKHFPTLYRSSTATTGNQIIRINRNELVYSLIKLYNFVPMNRKSNITMDVIPPIIEDKKSYVEFLSIKYPNKIIPEHFIEGYTLNP